MWAWEEERKKKKPPRDRLVRNIKQSRAELPLGRSASLSLCEYDKHDLVTDEGFVYRYTSPLPLRVSLADPPPLLPSSRRYLRSSHLAVSPRCALTRPLCVCAVLLRSTQDAAAEACCWLGSGRWYRLLRARMQTRTWDGFISDIDSRRTNFNQTSVCDFRPAAASKRVLQWDVFFCDIHDVYLRGFWFLRGFRILPVSQNITGNTVKTGSVKRNSRKMTHYDCVTQITCRFLQVCTRKLVFIVPVAHWLLALC